MSQVTWAHVTCEVTFQMRDRKLDKPLGVEDEAKWPAKLLDSRYEIENGPRVFITKSNKKGVFWNGDPPPTTTTAVTTTISTTTSTTTAYDVYSVECVLKFMSILSITFT